MLDSLIAGLRFVVSGIYHCAALALHQASLRETKAPASTNRSHTDWARWQTVNVGRTL